MNRQQRRAKGREAAQPRFVSPVIHMTDAETHHYFVMDADAMRPMCDDAGRIEVYTSRERAIAVAEARNFAGAMAVIGMGDEKWAAFQANESYVLAN